MSYPIHIEERAKDFWKLWNKDPLLLWSINTNILQGSQRRLP